MTCIVAHRGASGLVAHGNTKEAFDAAVAIGCNWVDLALRRTRDGTLLVHHDPDIRGVPLRALDVEDALRAGRRDGLELMTLHEVMERYATTLCFDVELKEAGYEQRVLDTVRRSHTPDRLVFTSFLESAVSTLRRLDPDYPTGLLLGQETSDFFPKKRLHACGANFAVPHRSMLGLGLLRRLRSMGLPAWIWTVNDTRQMRAMMELGVAGIITDRPDLALAVRASLHARLKEP